jgi:hypothetical protein
MLLTLLQQLGNRAGHFSASKHLLLRMFSVNEIGNSSFNKIKFGKNKVTAV